MGIVYLIEDPANRAYKIGATKKKANGRIKELQTGNSSELVLKETFETDYPFRLESMLHTRFQEYNVLNEWYDLPQETVCEFRKNCEDLNNIILSMKDNPFFAKGLK